MTTNKWALAVGEEPPPMEPSTSEPEPEVGESDGAEVARPGRQPRTTGNRFAVVNAFTDFSLAELGRAEIAVWLLLWRDTKRDGTARTSQADLARRAGCDRRSVNRAIRRLEGRGLVKAVYRGGLNRGPSRYRVRGHPEGP